MKNDLSVLDHLQIDPVTLKISGACNWEIDPVETGKRLRSLRLERSLSQEYVSALICANCAEGAIKNTVSLWETGKKLPSRDHLYFLARLYGVSIDALVLSYDQVPSEPDGERDQPSPFSSQNEKPSASQTAFRFARARSAGLRKISHLWEEVFRAQSCYKLDIPKNKHRHRKGIVIL